MMRVAGLLLAFLIAAGCGSVHAEGERLLQLEAKLPLGPVTGRIDHLAIDMRGQRLFVAELGNNSLGVIDLKSGTARTITGFQEPQGVAFDAPDTLYVANGADGSMRLYSGDALQPVESIPIGEDADNIRIDAPRGRVLVGYGGGALAILDRRSHARLPDIPLKAHPEGFQVDAATGQVFVNVPNAHQVAKVQPDPGAVTAWPVRGGWFNFPMALDNRGRVLIVTRLPAKLIVMSQRDGSIESEAPTCGDADDVFFDAKRDRVYVSCGDGAVDVFGASGGAFARVARIPTAPGARTSLFVPELDRLYVAVRASAGQDAAIWVFRPADWRSPAPLRPSR